MLPLVAGAHSSNDWFFRLGTELKEQECARQSVAGKSWSL